MKRYILVYGFFFFSHRLLPWEDGFLLASFCMSWHFLRQSTRTTHQAHLFKLSVLTKVSPISKLNYVIYFAAPKTDTIASHRKIFYTYCTSLHMPLNTTAYTMHGLVDGAKSMWILYNDQCVACKRNAYQSPPLCKVFDISNGDEPDNWLWNNRGPHYVVYLMLHNHNQLTKPMEPRIHHQVLQWPHLANTISLGISALSNHCTWYHPCFPFQSIWLWTHFPSPALLQKYYV